MVDLQRDAELPSVGASLRLRVLVFTTVFPNPQQPLHGSFVLERARHLADLAELRVMAPVPWFRGLRRAPLPEASQAFPVVHPVFWYPPKVLWALRGFFMFLSTVRDVARLRRNFDFDLIDAHFAYPDGFAAVLLGLWFRRPVCITLRGTIVQWSKRRLTRLLCDWAICRADRVIAVAESLAERARQGGVPDERVTTIANGIDGRRFRLIERAAARKSLSLPESGQLFASVGHISPRKGFHRVIRSLPRVIQSCPEARLVIVGGKGAEEDNSADLRAQVERLGLSGGVLFVGAQSPDRVALFLAAADVFVLASDFEGCPNVVLEAMACGRPVVAAKVGDIERMVPSFAGILFDDPEDDVALSDCLIAALKREWDAPQIRTHVSGESWDNVAEHVVAKWREAIEAHKQKDSIVARPSESPEVAASSRRA